MSHRSKKPYAPSSQPNITSYFTANPSGAAPSSSDPSTSRARTQAASDRLSPAVPAQIQSSLLNVGMRVRKSVPEGYKTHKTLPLSQPAQSIPPSQPLSLNPAAAHGPPSSSAPPALRRTVSDRSRELRPFCGLHAVGGYEAHGGGVGVEVPGLGWSQGTLSGEEEVGSFMEEEYGAGRGKGGEGRKRGYEEEVEDELDAFFGEGGGEGEMGSERVFARPRGRMGGVGGKTGVGFTGVVVAGDFDDADAAFLQPMDVDS